jgi:TetR/AcrR family transcriptional regulator, transcriptional repressor for nem operon
MTRTDGAATRERILDAAERLVLRQGFSATTVDAVIGELGITKGAFFHHFHSKHDLSLALVRRYADRDVADLHRYLERADHLSRDPLQRLLLFVGLLAEDAHLFVGENPGCLYGSYVYEQGLFGESVQEVVADAVLAWRETLTTRIRAVDAAYPARIAIDPVSLADTVLTAFEGSYVLSRATGDPEILRQQLGHVRSYLELLFVPVSEPVPAAG